jgi:triacylglycerol lipase
MAPVSPVSPDQPPEPHFVFLIPGMFGFARLAGYDYFVHVERELTRRFASAGQRCELVLVPSPPTGSIRRRARVLAETIDEACGDQQAPIHLVGHSTGGLDARLLVCPTSDIGIPDENMLWKDRIESVVSLNSPHHGTPVAQFFSTNSGTRLLYAISLLTFATLRFGGPSLTIFSSLVAALEGLDGKLGVNMHLLNRTTDMILRFIGDDARREVDRWLDGIQEDQGGIIQLMPEATEVFNACTENNPAVRYGYVATSAPPPSALRFAAKVRSPFAALSATVYSTLYAVASRQSKLYGAPSPESPLLERMETGLGRAIDSTLNDGVVPTLSMCWGELLWAGAADHLDILGHFQGRPGGKHTDWLHSGAGFGEEGFHTAMNAVVDFMLDE